MRLASEYEGQIMFCKTFIQQRLIDMKSLLFYLQGVLYFLPDRFVKALLADRAKIMGHHLRKIRRAFFVICLRM